MKIPTLCLSSVTLLGLTAFSEEITVDSIALQGAPALALSGSAPTEIARPTGAQELGLTLLGASSGGSFAFETKPYWWNDHSISGFYEQDYGWNVIVQTFSISAATYEVENAAGNDAAEFSFGIAFDLVRGGATERFKKAHEAHSKILDANRGVNLDSTNPEELRRRFQQQVDQSELSKHSSIMIDEMVKGRVGWNVSLAAATTYQFDDTEYNGGEFAKTGAWLVTSYTQNMGSESTEGDQISYMGILRYLDDQSPSINDSYFDAGARILWSLDELPLSISGEYIRRFADKSADSERITAMIEYQVNKQFSIFASHGLNFDDSSGKDEVLTLGGVSFGIGK